MSKHSKLYNRDVKSPISESVWDQIKSSKPEPWREATLVALSGHAKNQKQKHRRTLQANRAY